MSGELKKDLFFARLEALCLAVTFNDVRLKSGYSEVVPSGVDLRSRFSRNVFLNIPVVSAAMDTVTEFQMAIAMAEQGGLGIIHKGKGMTIEEQTAQVRKVKLHRHTRIDTPITVRENQSIGEVREMKRSKAYGFNSFPVLNDHGQLVGLLTRHHFDSTRDNSKLIKDIMTAGGKLIKSGPETTIAEAEEIMRREEKGVLPLVNTVNRLTGMYVLADILRANSASKTFNVDSEGHLLVGAAIGTGNFELERAGELVKAGVDVIVIDTAHGDSLNVLNSLKSLKRLFPGVDVVVGNVSEGDSAKRLAAAGADGIKVGQGGGSICTTRMVAGIGCPQVTAVYNCARELRGSDVIVCSDGGIVHSGDIPLALGAGAHCVMLGRGLAGTDEAPGEVKNIPNRGRFKVYRGMGSLEAMKDSKAARERYQQADSPQGKLVPEGITSMIPYEGSAADVLHKFMGGLRSGMGYVGAGSIEELLEKADYHRISAAGFQESKPHDVIAIDTSAME